MKTFEDIKFNKTDHPNGVQALVSFGDYSLSIVKNNFSYGGDKGLYEIAVYQQDSQIELPGITRKGDTVKGFLSSDEVVGIVKKMHLVTGAEPEQN
jgi:hypothetical protein|tara:strand:- start:2881 stop:3168 length:288 start_codon:yes stop_codon:yes gene_type:complete